MYRKICTANVPTTVGYNFLDNDTPFLPSQTYTTPPENSLTSTPPPTQPFPIHAQCKHLLVILLISYNTNCQISISTYSNSYFYATRWSFRRLVFFLKNQQSLFKYFDFPQWKQLPFFLLFSPFPLLSWTLCFSISIKRIQNEYHLH
jgi:hypothetical protein